MHRPVLISPPARLPVSVEEVRGYLPASPLSDDIVEGMIRAAVDYLDGWTGILGRCLVEQTWREEFDSFAPDLPLALLPVTAVDAVTCMDSSGAAAPVDESDYVLKTDAGGRSRVAFVPGSSFSGPVTVTYRAGYETVPADSGPPPTPERSTVPHNVKLAIVLMVQHMKSIVERDLFETQESVVGVGATMRAVTPYVGESITNSVDNLLSGLRVKRL